ncbi:MAG: MerR family transcriptional regulator, partial [Caldilineaceae bacterium]
MLIYRSKSKRRAAVPNLLCRFEASMSSKSTNQNASTHPQDVVDRVNSKNSQPISSPYRESLIINYPASSIGNFAFGEDPIEHLATRFQTLHEESIKQKSRLNNERPTFRLSDVAEKTGLSAQYINNLVVRYKLLNPTKTKEHGTRESYEFSEEDIELINRLKHLTIQGRPFREALEFLKEDVRYQNDAKRLMSAFQ